MLLSEDIAERVRDGRRQFGLTQTDLAKLVGVGRPTVARIEAGEAAHIALGTVERILNTTNWELSLDRGVRSKMRNDSFDMEAYLDSLYGDAR